MSDADTGRLMTLFDNNIIYSVTMSSLIAKGFLAEPIYETIDTNIDFDTTISLDEQRYIQKWGELSAETMERMARLTERNALIADRYVANKEKYGKTIIFALNATHCIALCEELQKRGVRCDYIYCAHSGNTEKIARFQKGELDVLVNIQVLTEGSDIPDIQTVFLTRPTSSDVLLMQMIGRGMRGPYSKGTKYVNIVDFHDLWGRFSNWLNPEFVIPSVEEDTTQDSASHSSTHSERAPWEMFRDILEYIHTSYPQFDDLASSAALPIGWYDVLDEEGNDSKVLVFESQLPGYINMWKNKALTLDNPNFNGQIALEKWFGGFGLLPNAHDIQLVMDMYKLSGEFPHLNHFKERNDIDAALIAMRLKDENVGIADLDGRADVIYKLLSSKVKDRSFYSMHERGATTLWEWWHGQRSHSHPMFGGCFKALFTSFLGINPLEAGYKRVRIAPADIEQLGNMQGYLTTPQGRLSVELKRGERIEIKVEIPKNTVAELEFASRRETLKEGKYTFEF
jgi:hypothetical protein